MEYVCKKFATKRVILFPLTLFPSRGCQQCHFDNPQDPVVFRLFAKFDLNQSNPTGIGLCYPWIKLTLPNQPDCNPPSYHPELEFPSIDETNTHCQHIAILRLGPWIFRIVVDCQNHVWV